MTTPKANNRKLSDFKPDGKNANKHTVRGMAMLEDSLQSLGAGRSILVDKNNNVIAGNATLETAFQTGFKDAIVVPTDGKQLVIVQRVDIDLDSPQGRKLALSDNRIAEVDLSWDGDALLELLNDGIDLSNLFDADELDALIGRSDEPTADPGAQMDKAAELQAKWQVKRGDLWTIGRHRLLCGDSTSAEDVARLGEVDVLITDPPYGIDYDPAWLDGVGRHRQALSSRDTLQGDDGSLDLSFLWSYERRMVWGFPYILDPQSTGWIVWDKQPGVDDRGIVTPIEMASTTLRKGFDMIRVMWGGYYRAAGEKREAHPTQKPVGVVQPFINDWTKQDEIIFDPFCGSGTTLVACEQTGRQGRAIEIEPKYVAVALERLSLMGLAPQRDGG